MHPWAAIDRYSQFHPRWFETADRYAPTDEHLTVCRAIVPNSWELRRTGIWYVVNPPDVTLPDQGWKLHVSVRSRDSIVALRQTLLVLKEDPAAFKFLLDPGITASVNGKLWPRGSGGKFITIYPSCNEQFHRLGATLAQMLQGLKGPYVLSDRRWPGSSSVYYRYGGFRARPVLRVDGRQDQMILDPDGNLFPDAREAFWKPPGWVDDPVSSDKSTEGAEVGKICDGRFSIISALGFTNRGGVYKAIDNSSGQTVVLKEARPCVEIGSNRLDAILVLQKEHRLLKQLSSTGYFAQPIAFFKEWEHAFLAEELVIGDHFGLFTILNNPLYSGALTASAVHKYLASMRELWLEVARAVMAAHERNIVLGDLSFTNIIVQRDSTIRIIDLEASVEEGVDPNVGLYTPGVSSPRAARSGVGEKASDYHALGAIMFGSIMLANGIAALYPPARHRFLDELSADLGLPNELVSLIDDLLQPATGKGSETSTLPDRIERLPFKVVVRNPALADAILAQGVPKSEARLYRQTMETVEGIEYYLRQTADLSRRDRLYPADLMVFETNPVSVAFGASGVLYALHRLSGDVPRRHLAWLLSHPFGEDHLPPGLYLGQAGVAWVLLELGYLDVAVEVMKSAASHRLLFESVDILRGAAGYGMTCLKMWKAGAGESFLNEAIRAGEHVLQQCETDERGTRWPSDIGIVPLGYAHGGSGIALFLLYLHLATGDPDPLRVARQALEFELAQAARIEGRLVGFPLEVTEGEQPTVASPYWDAGSAGVGTTLLRYLAATSDPTLEHWLADLVLDARHKYAVSPQLFHGLSGLGNFLLDVWELTDDKRCLTDCWLVAAGVQLFRIECPEGIAFPGEQAMRESADFATGAAGVGLFLHRLLQAHQGVRAANFNFVIDDLVPKRSAIQVHAR